MPEFNKKFVLVNCETNTLSNYYGDHMVCSDQFTQMVEPFMVELYRLNPQMMLDHLESEEYLNG